MAYSGAERLISPVGLLVPLDTDSLSEGANNLYFDTARVDSVIAGNSTVAGLASDISSNTVGIAANLALNQAVQQANADAIAATDLLRLENTVQAAVNETAIAATAADLITTNNALTTTNNDVTAIEAQIASGALPGAFTRVATVPTRLYEQTRSPVAGEVPLFSEDLVLPVAAQGARAYVLGFRIDPVPATTAIGFSIFTNGSSNLLHGARVHNESASAQGALDQFILPSFGATTEITVVHGPITSNSDVTTVITLHGYWL